MNLTVKYKIIKFILFIKKLSVRKLIHYLFKLTGSFFICTYKHIKKNLLVQATYLIN